MGNKKDIIEEFNVLSQYRKLQGDQWSRQAYDNVISALNRLPIDDITDIKHQYQNAVAHIPLNELQAELQDDFSTLAIVSISDTDKP